ncbi:glutathione S-transferase family protein [Seohaeicola zhoushanensis]|uniref:Glutathione S-transferase n=1 Tax=Seohaeicola zhoushanensis TaxID=1569283 RepID=A0A8J3GUA6_9RHOB|nr:glutathione S-transferase family protein [Seohaeicola zhoushanensis]GHF34610.1 glutathione S-transferase [Seohaeicola zhoushanensis]
MYKVYGVLASRAFRVMWLLDELGEPYELIRAAAHSPDIQGVNPGGKIPALQDGDDIITDSTAIMTYLADKHGKFTFPAGTIARARQDALTNLLLDEFDSVLWTASRMTGLLPEEYRVPTVVPALHYEFERNLNKLADRFEGPFLMGETMTIADILAVHCLNWATIAKFPVTNETLRAYARELSQRPAYIRARQTGM